MSYDKLSYRLQASSRETSVVLAASVGLAPAGIKPFRGAIRIKLPDRVFGI